jgi:hypothetical protein
MKWGKIFKSPQFWMLVGGIVLMIVIYNASPKTLDRLIEFAEREVPNKRKRGKNKYEEKCREIFERIFHKSFPTTRKVEWLKNPKTGRALELDGYNPDIETSIGRGLAFEYDGIQHAAPSVEIYGSNPNKAFLGQVYRDLVKNKLCKKNGLLLIRIHHLVPYEDLEKYIKEQLEKEGFEFQ